ncbi:universal stress protein [Streptomyces sp. A012304]|uniref:universal stress protein n=1 Tax=Streptomyces sp. A012304 TaxID=375446 RepID=UPI002230873E|nr:universal stress protein [Streptomyces sp. A012304]GKQ41490.1 universal stress protein [Streptomyces sp. A012304]
MTGPVVVGLDGSAASLTAAWWAAHEAAERPLPLLLLHSWTTQPFDVPDAEEPHGKQYGRTVLRRTAGELLDRHGDLALSTELVDVPAARALLDRGESAAVLVLGSRGHGSVASFLLGSISLRVLGVAPCPAVTVRAGDPVVEAGPDHPAAAGRDEIVVGLSEPGPASGPLLEFALTAARAHGLRVRAVRALQSSLLVSPAQQASVEDADRRREERERGLLAAVLGPWRERFPGVPVVEQVTTGPATQVLLSAAVRGRLTVVGRRRHVSRHTWKLGPVAHAALHHVPCPVAVVPHD